MKSRGRRSHSVLGSGLPPRLASAALWCFSYQLPNAGFDQSFESRWAVGITLWGFERTIVLRAPSRFATPFQVRRSIAI
jgi:hypothetical protein